MINKLSLEAKLNMEKIGKVKVKPEFEPKVNSIIRNPDKTVTSTHEALKNHNEFIARNIAQNKYDVRNITDLSQIGRAHV